MSLALTAFSRPSPTRRRSAYTLVEIMLVLSIIVVLLGAGVYYLVGNVEASKMTRVKADLSALGTQLNTYHMQNLRFPTTEQGLQALVSKPATNPVPRVWIQLLKPEALVDPWGNPYQYRSPGEHNPNAFDIWSWGPKGPGSTENILGNW
jgi:general secretion pathway protein G